MSRSKYQQLVLLHEWRAKLREQPRNGMFVRALHDVEARIAHLEEIHSRRPEWQAP